MKYFPTLSLLSAALLSTVSACTNVNSEDLATSGMYADIDVTAYGIRESRVTVRLRAGGSRGDTVELTGGDELTSTYDGSTRRLSSSGGSGFVSYRTSFVDEGGEGSYRISLDRSDSRTIEVNPVSAMDSFAIVPTPFEATLRDREGSEVNAGTRVSRSTGSLRVLWTSTSAERMVLNINSPCMRGISRVANANAGEYLLDASDMQELPARREGQPASTCTTTLRLRAESDGELDPNYGQGGQVRGAQERSVTFESVP